jgi:hypothetical protein
MEQLSGIWEDLLAWAVLVGVVAFAAVITRMGGHRRPAPAAAAPAVSEAPPAAEVSEAPTIVGLRRLDRAQEWRLVMDHASRGLERTPAAAALQSQAAQKIAAAEHAFNRIVAECPIRRRISAPSTAAPRYEITDPRRMLPHTPKGTPERRPLAA